MQQKVRTTKALLADALKKCMCRHSFDRITIKDITDEAGFIRPTFYNHFKDKYDLLEWIFRSDILLPVGELFVQEKYREGVRLVIQRMEQNKEFYLRAAKVEGQNSFRQIVHQSFCQLIYEVLMKYDTNARKEMRFLTPALIAEYYATAETFVLFKWLESGMQISATEVEKVHALLISFSFEDIIKEFATE